MAHREIDEEVPVLVVGAGPVGLLTSLQLAQHGVQNLLVERNLETTKWPKMDITNVRSMELLRRMGLADELRKQGVPGNYSFDVLFSSGLSDGGQMIAKWELASPDQWRETIRKHNDGSMPREPYQRCSQVVFEAWLKPILEANQMVKSHFGLRFESLVEDSDGVVSTLRDERTGKDQKVRSKYVIGCDGGGSCVRKSSGITLTGGPVPAALMLIHFRSRDLTRLHSQGQFWHIFFTGGAAIISQDEIDTFTVHTPIPLDADINDFDVYETVYKALGSSTGVPYPIKIDEILVKSSWRPNLVTADNYRSKAGRVFLAGDSAHQNIPTGGYGMNTGLGDAYDIGWKVAAVVNGWGGEDLLESYEFERRPVAIRNVERSGVHFSVHAQIWGMAGETGTAVLEANNEEGEKVRQFIRELVKKQDGENKELGLEMDFRFADSPVVTRTPNDTDHEWQYQGYSPSTRPGSRAPHVFLEDRVTSILDLYGPQFTLVDFCPESDLSKRFEEMAEKLSIPLKRVHLPHEAHARKVWGRDLVLVRPDGYVAWRSPEVQEDGIQDEEVKKILQVSVGLRSSDHRSKTSQALGVEGHEDGRLFSASAGNIDLEKPEDIHQLGAFQM